MILASGVHVYVYNEFGGRGERRPLGLRSRWPDPAECARDLAALGARGAIVQGVCEVPAWLTPACEAAFRDAGLDVAIGVGSRGPGRWQLFADGVIAALNRGVPVVPDWEEAWCAPGGRAAARLFVARVKAAFAPGAVLPVADAPWWAPLFTIDGDGRQHATHPDAPTLEMGALASDERFAQCYARGPGAAAAQLAWARHPSQYDAIARAGNVPPWRINGVFEANQRAMNDHVRTLMAERVAALWHYNRIDAPCALALRVVKGLRGAGFDGSEGLRSYQAHAGLTPDSVVGPRTLAALGLDPLP